MTDDETKMTKVDKKIKPSKEKYMVKDKEAKKVHVKVNKTDTGGNFYIYDLYDEDGRLVALNRYVYKDSDKQLFDKLTVEEEEILNPTVEDEEVI